MAEVLTPMFPQNRAATMLQNRPSSQDTYQNGGNGHQNQQPQSRIIQMSRSAYSNQNGGSSYRGVSGGAPVSPYAFKTTPTLRQDSRLDSRSTSSPPAAMLQSQSSEIKPTGHRHRYPAQASISTTSSSSSSNPPVLAEPLFTRDDSALFSNFEIPPFFSNNFGSSDFSEKTENALDSAVSKTPAERYKKTAHRRAESSAAELKSQESAAVGGAPAPDTRTPQPQKMGQFFYDPQQATKPSLQRATKVSVNTQPLPTNTENVTTAGTSVDALENQLTQSPSSDLPKRYRRRSSYNNAGPVEKAETGDSSPPSTSHDARPTSPGASVQRPSSSSARNEGPSSPGRSYASADSIRRTNNPSPLSRPMTANDGPSPPSSPPQQSFGSFGQSAAMSQSPAVAAMAALNMNDKEANKGMKSKFRRAFSFGSSAEMRRATGDVDTAADRARARQEQFSNELDEEQVAIARQQEAAGLGNSIYSGQGNVFAGSTDNLSVSSTASSASLMLRKMGKGMKKGGKSLKGLFRPKSVVGVPAADGPISPTIGQVSMVTVEAEREKVNVNADPHEQAGGGTSFPRLERNSVEVARASMSQQRDSEPLEPRRSIVGGEKDRAEVLAAVKRGILKRPNTGSPIASPSYDQTSPNGQPERRGSPSPSTTSSEPRRHKRTDSTTLEGDDYFAVVPRLGGNQSSRSLPGTPRSMARNISFSPRIQFHDVWSSTEYDRRGDIATCNRLTPMLAQQIKEELNTFKMEMEVHELSKPHTHFF